MADFDRLLQGVVTEKNRGRRDKARRTEQGKGTPDRSMTEDDDAWVGELVQGDCATAHGAPAQQGCTAVTPVGACQSTQHCGGAVVGGDHAAASHMDSVRPVVRK